MKHLFFYLILLTAGFAGAQSEHKSLMAGAPNDSAEFTIQWPEAGDFTGFKLFITGDGGSVGIRTSANYLWAQGPSDSTSIFGGEKPFVFDPGAGLPIWFLGDCYVGMSYGGKNLIVRGTITSDGQPVPRWLGRLSGDPSQKNAGDTYWNTTTSKARLWNGTAWVDLN